MQEVLAETLAPEVNGKTVLWARASRGREVLANMLSDSGGTVVEVVVYNNEDVSEFPPETTEAVCRGDLDWVGLSSPSIARQFAKLMQQADVNPAASGIKVASISPVTSEAAVAAGISIDAEATTYTWNGILAAIESFEGANRLPGNQEGSR